MRAKTIVGAGLVVAAAAAVIAAAALGAFSSGTPSASPGSGESVKVHGEWTIRVLDHGRLVRQVHFHNALVASGNAAFVALLTRQRSLGEWYVTSDGTGGDLISEFSNLHPLTATQGSGADAGKIVLQGTDTVGSSGTIAQVQSNLLLCNPPTGPTSPPGGTLCSGTDYVVTQATLPSSVPVVAGQQTLFLVKIWFS
jgi:hypothetical protein